MIQLHLLTVPTDASASMVITAWNLLSTPPRVKPHAFLHASMPPHHLAPPIQTTPSFGPVENSNSSFKISAQHHLL